MAIPLRLSFEQRTERIGTIRKRVIFQFLKLQKINLLEKGWGYK